MPLKAKKGYGIARKSISNRLWTMVKSFSSFDETRVYFNEVIHYFFMLINTDLSGLDVPISKNGGWRYYEQLVKGDKTQFELPDKFKGCPAVLMRAAIRKAIGAYKSWKSNYHRWLNRPLRYQHHRPPLHPRSFNFCLQYDQGMWKQDSGSDVVLKVLIKGEWKWIKFRYNGTELPEQWVKGAPSIVCKRGMMFITFPYQRYVPATGGLKAICQQEKIRLAAFDIDLDKHAAIVSILELEDNSVWEVARHFIKNPSEINLRKRDLGRIAKPMGKTGIVHQGFCFSDWEKIRLRERDMGYKVARKIINLAQGYRCQFIANEHLGYFLPCKGKYSRRSNQKRSYWLKSKIFNNVRNNAYADYGILTTRVNPRNTSRLDPWGNPVNRTNHIRDVVVEAEVDYQPGATWVKTACGYTAHSGVNAARNIGIRAIERYRTNLKFVVKSEKYLDGPHRNTHPLGKA